VRVETCLEARVLVFLCEREIKSHCIGVTHIPTSTKWLAGLTMSTKWSRMI